MTMRARPPHGDEGCAALRSCIMPWRCGAAGSRCNVSLLGRCISVSAGKGARDDSKRSGPACVWVRGAVEDAQRLHERQCRVAVRAYGGGGGRAPRGGIDRCMSSLPGSCAVQGSMEFLDGVVCEVRYKVTRALTSVTDLDRA